MFASGCVTTTQLFPFFVRNAIATENFRVLGYWRCVNSRVRERSLFRAGEGRRILGRVMDFWEVLEKGLWNIHKEKRRGY